MRRYWIPPEFLIRNAQGEVEVCLTGDVLHHIRDVCRQGKGSRFEVIVETNSSESVRARLEGLMPTSIDPSNGMISAGGAAGGNANAASGGGSEAGRALLVEITIETKRESIARVIETRAIAPLPEPHLHLALSIPRPAVLEAVVEKMVEMGVYAIHPFYSDFSFVRTQADFLEKKRTRIQKIIESATQQSGRGEKMRFHDAVDLKALFEIFNRSGRGQGLFAYEGASVLSARQGIEELKRRQAELGTAASSAERGPVLREIWAFIGSEGGFSEPEVKLFQSQGLQPVTLGPQVLRVETACVATISIIKYGFELMRVE